MSQTGTRVTTGAVVVLALVTVLSLPDSALNLEVGRRSNDGASSTERILPVVAGAFHVHTSRSDGTSTIEEVAEAASTAGLGFVVVTDHGAGTRTPEAPRYHANVLVLDGIEVSTTGGHYLSVGQRQAPYPLGGEARDVAEDIARLGGFGVAAHPGSPKNSLRWQDWTTTVDGLEWLNADSAWRDESWLRLVLAMLHYPMRSPQAIAEVFDRPTELLLRWDGLTQRQRVVALACSDAHGARVQPFSFPSYEQVFRTFGIRVLLDEAWTGNAAADGAALLEGLRNGRVYTVIDALARPGRFNFFIRSADGITRSGGVVSVGGPFDVEVKADLPPGGEIRLFENGAVVRRTRFPQLSYRASGKPSVFRAEVALPSAPGSPSVPWILGNPIYVVAGNLASKPSKRETSNLSSVALFTNENEISEWTVEHEEESLAAVDSTVSPEGRELAFRYALSDSESVDPFVALVRDGLESLGRFDRIRFRVRGDAPQRLAVQLRTGNEGAVRWRRSVYVNTETRDVTVRLQDMQSLAAKVNELFRVESRASLLFVVDTVNTAPATAGVIWLDDVRLERED